MRTRKTKTKKPTSNKSKKMPNNSLKNATKIKLKGTKLRKIMMKHYIFFNWRTVRVKGAIPDYLVLVLTLFNWP